MIEEALAVIWAVGILFGGAIVLTWLDEKLRQKLKRRV